MASKNEPSQADSASNPTETVTLDVDLDLLTWNASGKKPTIQDTGTRCFPLIREAIVPKVRQLLEKTVDITLFQEMNSDAVSSWGYEDLLIPKKKGKNFEVGMSPSPRPDGSETAQKRIQIIQDSRSLEKILKESEVPNKFIERLCGSPITISKSDPNSTGSRVKYSGEVIVLSYHAQYTHLKDKEKKENTVEFFEAICKVADKEKKTIIIGGDFNYYVLGWKGEVERKFLEGRVKVELYIASPRRWHEPSRLIDTFAIVHPKKDEYPTLCTFKKTTAIYCFPLDGYIGGKQTILEDYPSSDNVWFKYLHYTEGDKDEICEELKKKVQNDVKTEAAKKKKASNKATKRVEKEPASGKGMTAGEKKPVNSEAKARAKKKQASCEAKARAVKKPACGIEKGRAKKEQESGTKAIAAKRDPAIDELSKSMEKLALSQPYSGTKILKGSTRPPPVPLWPTSVLHCIFDHDPVLTTVTCTLKLIDSATELGATPGSTFNLTPKSHKAIQSSGSQGESLPSKQLFSSK